MIKRQAVHTDPEPIVPPPNPPVAPAAPTEHKVSHCMANFVARFREVSLQFWNRVSTLWTCTKCSIASKLHALWLSSLSIKPPVLLLTIRLFLSPLLSRRLSLKSWLCSKRRCKRSWSLVSVPTCGRTFQRTRNPNWRVHHSQGRISNLRLDQPTWRESDDCPHLLLWGQSLQQLGSFVEQCLPS